MDYKKIYDQLISKALGESREKTKNMYYEKHHIIPDFMFMNRGRKGPAGHLPGNPNDTSNLILLTPKEHFISHILLWKIYKNTHYGYACGSALQFFSKVIGNHPRSKNSIGSRKYEIYRSIGLSSISASRKNTFPAKDSVTGISVGSVNKNHPKVLSGEWVHHSKGVLYTAKRKAALPSQKGSDNTNFKEISETDFIPAFVASIEDNHFKFAKFLHIFNKNKSRRESISTVYIRNHYNNVENFVKIMNEILKTAYKYNIYHRSNSQKNKSSEHSKLFIWLTDGVTNKRIHKSSKDEFIANNPTFSKGRTLGNKNNKN